ncbi:hypothetical protein POVWA2_054330 [Plasmodium ovale wallikeri]|uniref:Uncharacterized protein n=1 Tax=Plasmodium ovale wallikeri TaxID=864142 RepID=A0A1A8YIS8_PLAOA|nr:hypothetical protein POVWA1_007130 [Plasmodium ovale wallikeri]SBT47601.1 hypothetical protein POVWA2_054330 [Plasmodium ovale wallikeri]
MDRRIWTSSLLGQNFPFRHVNRKWIVTKPDEIVKAKSPTMKKKRFKNIYVDFSLNKYININSLNVDRFIKTPIHYQTFKELVDTIKCVSNVRLQNIHLVRKILNSLDVYIMNYLNNLQLFNDLKDYRGGFLQSKDNTVDVDHADADYYVNEGDDSEHSVTPNSIVTILISLYKLKYRNERFLKVLENYIFVNKEKFKISQMHLILYIYSYFDRVNKPFINSTLVIILNNKNELNADNILNIFTSLFYLDCKNEKTLDLLTSYIISNNLDFDINVIIFLLSNLKKLNYSNPCLLEYFHNQVILKLNFLNPQVNREYMDSFFLKRNIQWVIEEEANQWESDQWESPNGENGKWDRDQSEGKHHGVGGYRGSKGSEYPGECRERRGPQRKEKMNNEDAGEYGSLHNKYIVENNYVDYIYEYYNKKDIEDKKKSKITLLMEVLIYYKYFKEDLLKVLYEYLLNNLKKLDKEDMYKILSNIYLFEINKFPYIIFLNTKLLLSMCHYYVPSYKKCSIITFLFLKILLEKYHCFNIFIDEILVHKINTEILSLKEEQFLSLLNQYKNTSIIRYLCDISLIYNDFFKLKGDASVHGKVEHFDGVANMTDITNICSESRKGNSASEFFSTTSGESLRGITHLMGREKKMKVYEFNPMNRLHTYNGQFLLQFFHFYVKREYYQGVFLFLKSLFIGVKNLKNFDPYVYYVFTNYYPKEEIKNREKILKCVENENMFKKLNALYIIHIYEHFKSLFESYEDFFCKKNRLINFNHDLCLYHFYLNNYVSNGKDGADIFLPIDGERKTNVGSSEDKHLVKSVSKYLFTSSKINYVSCQNRGNVTNFKGQNNTSDSVHSVKIDRNINRVNRTICKDEEIGIVERNAIHTTDESYTYGKRVSLTTFEGNTFEIDNYIYNILNNIFMYTPVNLFVLYIHYFNSNNIFFLLKNIIFKLNYLNVNYISIVMAKIYHLANRENCDEILKRRYIIFLDFFHDYLLGDEINCEKFSYQGKQKKNVNSYYNLNSKEKRLIINNIHLNCITKNNETVKHKYSETVTNAPSTKRGEDSSNILTPCNDNNLHILDNKRGSLDCILSLNSTNAGGTLYFAQAHDNQLIPREFLNKGDSTVQNRIEEEATSGSEDVEDVSNADGMVKEEECGDASLLDDTPARGSTRSKGNSDSGNEDAIKTFTQIYILALRVRYFHKMPVNKHIFRELCINNKYIDNRKFLNFLFFLYKYKFDEMRIIEFLCKKLKIGLEENSRTIPTKQTSYDYQTFKQKCYDTIANLSIRKIGFPLRDNGASPPGCLEVALESFSVSAFRRFRWQ